MTVRSRLVPVLLAAVLTAAVGLSGQVVAVQPPADPVPQRPAVGRQLTVCPVQTGAGRAVRLGVVVAEGVTAGRLVGTELGSTTAAVDLDQPGSARQIAPRGSILLRTEGGFSAGTAAGVLATARTGPARGLTTLTCQTAGTQHWFTGVAADASQTTRLVLTNPDNAEAEVDLHFYGSDGPVGAPGSLGIVIPSTTTQEISLAGLLPGGVTGPLAVQVTTSRGRVSAYAQSTYRAKQQPAGEAWAEPMPAPQTSMVIAGVPGGRGERELVLATPSARRAQVTVEVLGADGVFAPADTASVDVDAESTQSAGLDDALDGEAVAVRLTSTEPITAAIVSTSDRGDAAPDVAVQPVATPVRGRGLLPYAFASGVTAQLVISNNGSEPASVQTTARTFGFEVAGEDEVTVEPGATSTVDLPDEASGFVEVRTDAAEVYAGVVLSTPSGDVAGLATGVVASAAAADPGGQVTMDPRTGR